MLYRSTYSHRSFVSFLPRSSLLATCWRIKLFTCFQDDNTLVCPHSVVHKLYEPDWLGLPWTPSTKMSFPRLHSTALDCSNLHPLLHLGGRHYLSTTSSTLSVNGLTNRSTIHLSPLMVYHFPCEVTFPEQQTGFGACPSRLEITVAPPPILIIFPGTPLWIIQYWISTQYQSLDIPPPSTFNRSTLDSLDKTFQTLDGHLDYKLDKIRQDINQIQETSTTSLNDALTYAAFGLALLNTVWLCFFLCRFARPRYSSATQNSASTTKGLVYTTTPNFTPPQCEHCHKPRRQISAPL